MAVWQEKEEGARVWGCGRSSCPGEERDPGQQWTVFQCRCTAFWCFLVLGRQAQKGRPGQTRGKCIKCLPGTATAIPVLRPHISADESSALPPKHHKHSCLPQKCWFLVLVDAFLKTQSRIDATITIIHRPPAIQHDFPSRHYRHRTRV